MPLEKKAIITKVIAGLILAAIIAVLALLRDSAFYLLLWLWEQIVWLISFISRNYPIPGWAIIVFCCLALPSIFRFISLFRKQPAPAHASYVEDHFHGAIWRWDWAHGHINNLDCYCPACDATLVYDDSSCNIYARLNDKRPGTAYICEHCGHQQIAFIAGGNREYALGAIEREITRKVRTGEYNNVIKT